MFGRTVAVRIARRMVVVVPREDSAAGSAFTSAAGLGVEETAQQLGIWRKTAGHWRRRWRDAAPSAGVAARLSDAPRCGAPARFTPEAICQIMALACEDPETLGVAARRAATSCALSPGTRHCHRMRRRDDGDRAHHVRRAPATRSHAGWWLSCPWRTDR